MSLRLIPLASSLLAGIAATQRSPAFPGFPLANITDATDLERLTLLRGSVQVVAGGYDQIFIDGAGAVTVAAGTYSMPELCARMTIDCAGLANNQRFHWRQDSAARHHVEHTSSAGSILNNGTTITRNILFRLCGYNQGNTASATTHTADFPVIHHLLANGTTGVGDQVQWDLTAARTATCAVLIYPELSAGGEYRVHFGTTATAIDATETSISQVQGVMPLWFAAERTYRYVTLELYDPHRDDFASVGAGFLHVGRYFEPTKNWAPSAHNLTRSMWVRPEELRDGQAFLGAARVRDRLRLAWDGSGLGADDSAGLAALYAAVGLEGYVVIASDPTDESVRETRLCRVAEPPTLTRRTGTDRTGHDLAELTLEVVA